MMRKMDVIAILGGGMIKDKNGWRTTRYNEGDGYGIIGDRLRVVAAYMLYRADRNKLFIASGGKGLYKNTDAPIIADVVEKELIELGVTPNLIVKESRSINTYQQLKFLAAILAKRKINRLKIVSNYWHLPRIKAMLQYAHKLKDIRVDVKLISAEKVLVTKDPKTWKKIIQNMKTDDKLKQRIDLEKKGIQQIKSGQYKFK